MKRVPLLCIIIILLLQTPLALSAINEKTIITIDVFENGSALWSEEKFYPLPSQSAISEWNFSLKDPENNSRGIGINESINKSLLSAINYSGRPMRIQNFNISYELADTSPEASGIIRLSFEWVNFSNINGSNITIGDAFSDTVVPSLDNVLIIKIPQGFEAINASPGIDRRDDKENMLIWDGTIFRSFKKGEPSFVLSRKSIPIPEEPQKAFPIEIAIILILVVGSILFLFMRGYFLKLKDDLMKYVVSEKRISDAASKPGYLDAKGEAEIEPDEEEEAVQSGPNTDLPPITEDIPGYEEMIERHLKKCGGQAYQSDIVKESGLSKSTISIVLSRMKDEGRILKIRKGKENVIRLTKIE